MLREASHDLNRLLDWPDRGKQETVQIYLLALAKFWGMRCSCEAQHHK